MSGVACLPVPDCTSLPRRTFDLFEFVTVWSVVHQQLMDGLLYACFSIRGVQLFYKLGDTRLHQVQTGISLPRNPMRRKILAIYWKQWKRVRTRYRMIRSYHLPEWEGHEMANCRKGVWRATLMLNSVLLNKEIARLGYMSMTDYYLRVREK